MIFDDDIPDYNNYVNDNDGNYGNEPADIYLLKVNNRNTRTRCEMFKVNNKNGVIISLSLLTLNIFHTCSGVSIVIFEYISAGWVRVD